MQTDGKMRQSGEAMRRDKTELNNIDKALERDQVFVTQLHLLN